MFLSLIIRLEFAKLAMGAIGFLPGQDAMVCKLLPPVSEAEQSDCSALPSDHGCLYPVKKNHNSSHIIPISPTGTGQVNNKTRIYNTKLTLQFFFFREVIARF